MSTPDVSDLLPPRLALPAAGMSVPSYQTLHRRGQLPRDFFGRIENGKRLLSHRGFLALAAHRVVTGYKLEIGELPPAAFLRWAELWMRTRDADKRVRELWLRFYGRPGDPDSKVSLLPNADVLCTEPAPGALLTVVFDLDEIFTRAERALAERAAEAREIWEGIDEAE